MPLLDTELWIPQLNGTFTRRGRPVLGTAVGGTIQDLLAESATRPVRGLFVGSSITQGTGATTTANRFVNQLTTLIQDENGGAVIAPVNSPFSVWGTKSNLNGFHAYNGGKGGSQATNFRTDSEIALDVALPPDIIFVDVGINDWRADVNPTTFKANLASAIGKYETALAADPPLYVFLHIHQATDVQTDVSPYTWEQYGTALAELAATNPRFTYMDLHPGWQFRGVPGADPYGFMDPDEVHLTDAGHAYMAQLIWWQIMNLPGQPPPPDTFVLGTTKPQDGVNVGPDTSLGTLDPYTGTGAGNVLTITTAAGQKTDWSGVDFGNTRVVINRSDVHFDNCAWKNTIEWRVSTFSGATPNPVHMADCAGGSATAYYQGRRFFRCDFSNETHFNPHVGPVRGHGYVAERCSMKQFADGFSSFSPSWDVGGLTRVEWLGNHCYNLMFQYSPVQGVAHPSDTKRIGHPDLIQHQGGRGCRAVGNFLNAHYTEVWGSGAPGSGKDTPGSALAGVTQAPTQAEGDAKWFEFIEVNGTLSTGTRAKTASITCVMCNFERGSEHQWFVDSNWFSGGNVPWNAADTGLTGDLGVFTNNRHKDDNQFGGTVYLVNPAVTGTWTGNKRDPDNGTTITRTNA